MCTLRSSALTLSISPLDEYRNLQSKAELSCSLPSLKMSKRKKVKAVKITPVIYDLPIKQKFLIASSYLLSEFLSERLLKNGTDEKELTDEALSFLRSRLSQQAFISEVDVDSVLAQMLFNGRSIVLTKVKNCDEL